MALPLAVVSAVVAACGSTDTASAFRASEAADAPGGGNSGGSTSFNPSDASSNEKTAPSGSPLCGSVANQCLPDDDGRNLLPAGVTSCAKPIDADTPGSDAGVSPCRLVAKDGKVAPECATGESANPDGIDGFSCSKGSDCAPGFDCVDGEKGPVCRRYCCSGSCASQMSQNGGATFCDIQTLVDYRRDDVKAPVCMPVKTCKLLRPGECSDKETCAVINESGDTGCVALGSAKAGESCDKEHCASELTCLGSPGNRRCYKLCRVDGADCAPMQTCTTGSVFQDTTFGVCKDY